MASTTSDDHLHTQSLGNVHGILTALGKWLVQASFQMKEAGDIGNCVHEKRREQLSPLFKALGIEAKVQFSVGQSQNHTD